MSIRDWLAKFRQRRDAAAMARVAGKARETHKQRAATVGDISEIAADQQAARIAGQTPSEADRLGE